MLAHDLLTPPCLTGHRFAVLDPSMDLGPVLHAVRLLQQLHPPAEQQQQRERELAPASSAPATTPPEPSAGVASGAAAGGNSSSAALRPAQAAARPARERAWDPPRPRATQVLLPQSPASDLPEWFFSRTGGELKAAFLAAVRKREQQQVL